MTFDLFADPDPEPEDEAPATPPAVVPRADRVWTSPRLRDDQPCAFPLGRGAFKCGIGGGAASGSIDGGRTWFCPGHRPWGYLPTERDPEDRPARRGS